MLVFAVRYKNLRRPANAGSMPGQSSPPVDSGKRPDQKLADLVIPLTGCVGRQRNGTKVDPARRSMVTWTQLQQDDGFETTRERISSTNPSRQSTAIPGDAKDLFKPMKRVAYRKSQCGL